MPKTTEQLECLIDGRGDRLQRIVLDVEELLAQKDNLESAVAAAVNLAGEYITKGEDVLVMTSRKLITGADELSSLNIGSVVAAALVLFLRLLVPRPRYVIAKVSRLLQKYEGIVTKVASREVLHLPTQQRKAWECGVPKFEVRQPQECHFGDALSRLPSSVGSHMLFSQEMLENDILCEILWRAGRNPSSEKVR